MQDNAPRLIPGAGGTSVLRVDYGAAYGGRSIAYRCVAKGCFRRGFPISVGAKCTIACAVHLNDQITHVANVDVPDGDVDLAAPATQPTKKPVTAQLDRGEILDKQHRENTGMGALVASSETSSGSE